MTFLVEYDIMKKPASYQAFSERRCVVVANILNFILSVIAGIYSYYICKWLDGKK